MAKFNRRDDKNTVNRTGFPAYAMKDRDRLVTAVLTTMLGEPKFYGTTDGEIFRLGTRCAIADPGYLYRLACYARKEMNLRSVSHVLACIIARDGRVYTRPVIRNVAVRPDDLTEIMACWLQMYGKPFPNAMKREIGKVIQRFDAYALARYNGGNRTLRFRDVLRITHPKPKDAATEALFRKVLDDTLPVPYTWETEVSRRGNSAEVWNELIASGRVGYMALLRNLRNILRCGADAGPVLERLSDPEQVRGSRQLPFRFFSAYMTLQREGMMTPEIHRALEKALTVSLEQMETIPGRTLIAVDCSGSMRTAVSRKSAILCQDIAVLLGAMAGRICEDSDTVYFDCSGRSGLPSEDGCIVEHYTGEESILDICLSHRFWGGGTEMNIPLEYALHRDPRAGTRPYDRMICFSDNICNRAKSRGTVQHLADLYRQQYNPAFWVHGVDLQGYGTQQFCGKRFNLIAGWGEKVLDFILLAEKGLGTLAQTIAQYDPEHP